MVLVLPGSCKAEHGQAPGAGAASRLSPGSEGFLSARKQCLTRGVITPYDFLIVEDNKTKIRRRFKNFLDAFIYNKIHLELLQLMITQINHDKR